MDLTQAMQVAAAGMKVQGARVRLVAYRSCATRRWRAPCAARSNRAPRWPLRITGRWPR
jgi:hypothetical protein